MSSYYFDALKDTLYTSRKNSFLRRSAQSGLFEILSRLVRLFAPILSFTMDEVWSSFPIEEGIASVHESNIDIPKQAFVSSLYTDWERIRTIRDTIMPSLEKKRASGLIGSSLDAKIYIKTEEKSFKETLQKNLTELKRIFIVSQVLWMDRDHPEMEAVTCRALPSMDQAKVLISVEKADGKKCDRCWNYSIKVGSFPEDPTLCERCVEAIR